MHISSVACGRSTALGLKSSDCNNTSCVKDLECQPTVTSKQWINLLQVSMKIGYATDTSLNNLIFHLHLFLSALSSERVSYFESLQNLLQRESSKGYAALCACCERLQSDFEDKSKYSLLGQYFYAAKSRCGPGFTMPSTTRLHAHTLNTTENYW